MDLALNNLQSLIYHETRTNSCSKTAQLAETVEYANCIFAEKYPPPNECPGYDSKLHLMLKLQSCSFEECEILHSHYSQDHSHLVC